MSKDKDKDHLDSKTRLRELEEERKRHPHAPRKELHEDADLHPHHKESDHVRHHHSAHTLKHHRDETPEEKKFVDRENYLHRIERNRETWEDEAGRKQMRKTQKASATPGQAVKYAEAVSATPATKKGVKVKASSSTKVADQLNQIRLRIAFARAQSRERGEKLFGR